jgi:hypothetical protein
MEYFTDRYGSHFVRLVDSRSTCKEFEFDQVLLIANSNRLPCPGGAGPGRDQAQGNEISIRRMLAGSHRDISQPAKRRVARTPQACTRP